MNAISNIHIQGAADLADVLSYIDSRASQIIRVEELPQLEAMVRICRGFIVLLDADYTEEALEMIDDVDKKLKARL